ncbi:MAG TPA: HAD family hydrolase [Polyangiales bacterium]|nr:HAD family hydrolase [Polyangiales bacterium]
MRTGIFLPWATRGNPKVSERSVAGVGCVDYTIRIMGSGFPDTIHTVTFDCWSTLIYEAKAPVPSDARERKRSANERRAARLAAALAHEPQLVAAAFAAAWKEHQRAWHRRESFTGEHMLDHTLRMLSLQLTAAQRAELLRTLEDEISVRHVQAAMGARELLAHLRARGIRTALICDTGFTPGRVVRQLLADQGLLELLELTIFSDEIGVTKPHPRAFASALAGLGVAAQGAVHVGDIRRSDIAGARAAGMGSVRFTGLHDDHDDGDGGAAGVIDCAAAGCTPPCARPEADQVVSTYTALRALLEPRLVAVSS